jgi:glycosyltransferase involved in cell wall biosynthesis
MANVRLISIIASMLNEAEHVERLVSDVAAQDFEGDAELIVADGGSADGSVERLKGAAERRRLSFAAAASIRARRESGSLMPRVTVFPAFHLGYGIGMLRGWANAAGRTTTLR